MTEPNKTGESINALPVKAIHFKEIGNYRKVEQIIMKCCALCEYSRPLKMKIAKSQTEMLVCGYTQNELFPTDWNHVCDNYE